jgi:hypothetical protein
MSMKARYTVVIGEVIVATIDSPMSYYGIPATN